MKTGKKRGRLLSLVLILLVSTQMILQAGATEADAEKEEIISIKNAEDFMAFAEECTLDTWSQGKTFVLETDITLEQQEFVPIPSFGGIFDGNGHSITGVNITGSYSPAGFFGVLQKTAVVKNLSISGSIHPDGTADMVGGIAGKNSGTIINCSFCGYVTGKDSVGGIVGVNEAQGEIRRCQSGATVVGSHSIGGIAGTNHGILNNCKNAGDINTSISDITYAPSDFSVGGIEDVRSTSNTVVHMDTGGIAGLSDGKIYYCSNSGAVGYPHVGYNVGGIVGRLQQGYLQNCTNTGHIQGRKDVAGIAGQMEPFLEIRYINGKLDELEQETEKFFELADAASKDLHRYGNQATTLIKSISADLKAANTAAGNVSTAGNQLWTVYNQELKEINEEFKQYREEQEDQEGQDEQEGFDFEPDRQDYEETMNELLEKASGHMDDALEASEKYGGTIGDNMELLNTSMDSAGSSLQTLSDVLIAGTDETNENIEALSEQSKVLRGLINEIRNDLFRKEKISVTDVSDKDISETDVSYDASTFQKGKITLCTNRGLVEADLNVAGITGQIGTEYDMDPESDIAYVGTETFETERIIKAVVRNSKNYGEIISKKDYVGGIVGKSEIGAVILCENYGKITSAGGNYVGGIAGSLGGTVRECYVKSTLSGKNYVGGIIGSGKDGEESSIVLGCYSLVDIEEGEQYIGAIAGVEKGIFRENYFVSEELAGINYISSTGKAEPVSYEMLRKTEGMPPEFEQFTLEFVADRTGLRTITFSYGDSLDESVFPEIPQKDGYYAKWNRTDLTELCFDTVVTAEYFPYVTALASEEHRSDERPVFFVEGQFKDGDTVFVELQPEDTELLNTILKKENLMERTMKQAVVEQWCIIVPEDNLDVHTVRYLAADEKRVRLDIYVLQADKWTKVQTEENGSYLLFDVAGGTVELAVVAATPIWWIRILIPIVSMLFLFVILQLVRKCRKWKKKELEKGKKRWILLIVILGVAVCLLGGVILFLLLNAGNAVDAYKLLRKYEQQEELSMELMVTAEVGSEQIDKKLNIVRTTVEGKRITCIEENGIKLYYADEMIFLENGKAFQTSELFPDYSRILGQIAELYQTVDIKVSDTDAGKQYRFTTKKEGAKTLTELLLPDFTEELADNQTMSVTVTVNEEKITGIEILTDGSLNDSGKTSLKIRAEMLLSDEVLEEAKISRDIVDMISEKKYKTENILTEDLFKLALAWSNLKAEETQGQKLKLTADCGPVAVNDELLLIQKTENGVDINCIRKNERSFYYTEDRICDQNGRIVLGAREPLMQSAKLPDIAYQLCLNGNLSCIEARGEYIYTLVLEKEGMNVIAYAMAPETMYMDILFDTGSIQITVKEDQIVKIQIGCDGSLNLAADTPVSFRAELDFDEDYVPEGFSIPSEVMETLTETKAE